MTEHPLSDRQSVEDIAKRHGFGPEAGRVMLDALVAGGGGMAQFAHSEFGGSGQWMRGSMTMAGSLSDHGLKARVDALCNDLAALVGRESGPARSGSFQSQHQGHPGKSATDDPSLVVPPQMRTSENWWPGDLGSPDSSGAQNGTRYAYFAGPRRLAIELGGKVTVYDTGGHQIGGVAQQQSVGGSLKFTSQHGTVSLARLPVVS